jgi:uncharacterized membrane protein
MPVIENTIVLHAPVEKVFRYLIDPIHLPEFCSDVSTVNVVQHYDANDTQFAWSAKMVGVHFEGMATVKNLGHNERIEIHFWGGLKGSVVWLMHPKGQDTELIMSFEYTAPQPLVRKHRPETLIEYNQAVIEDSLQILKTLLEEKTVIAG